MRTISNLKNNKSSVLIEILLAISLFALVSGSISLFSIDAVRNTKLAEQKNQMVESTKEVINAINVNKKDTWSTLSTVAFDTPYTYTFASNKYTITAGSTTTNGITSNFTVQRVYRDVNGNIATTGGTEDIHSRKITINATWTDLLGQVKNVNQEYFINDWSTKQWFQTTYNDFYNGTPAYDKTRVNGVTGGDGNVQLTPVIYSDWCKPQLSSQNIDLSRNGIPKAMKATFGNIYAVTGDNASGYTFGTVHLSSDFPPTSVTYPGTYNVGKGYAIYVDSGYAYMGSVNPNPEVAILDLSSVTGTYSRVGFFDAPGNGQTAGVAVKGNAGFALVGNKLYSFDITTKVGATSRPQLQVLTLAATGTSLTLNGNYLYATITGNSTKLQIIDITNPSSMSIVSAVSPSAGNGQASFVNADGSRLYLATSYNATYPEVFIYNITTKSSPSQIGSYDTGTANMVISAISVPKSTRIVVAGSGGTFGQDNYIVLNSTNESLLSKCGGMEVSGGINDLSTVEDVVSQSVYTYVLVNNSASELKIIRGGEGGGDASGNGYATGGSYISNIFDTGGAVPTYYSLEVKGELPINATANVKIRTSASTNMLGATAWVNVNGDSTTGVSLNTVVPMTWNTSFNQRYVQYMVTFGSDTVYTPTLDSIRVSYQL